jgi:hypothetical protein
MSPLISASLLYKALHEILTPRIAMILINGHYSWTNSLPASITWLGKWDNYGLFLSTTCFPCIVPNILLAKMTNIVALLLVTFKWGREKMCAMWKYKEKKSTQPRIRELCFIFKSVLLLKWYVWHKTSDMCAYTPNLLFLF